MTQKPLQEGLFEEADGKQVLAATRCRACGQVLFPRKERCLNCLSEDVETIKLSRRGALYTYTTVYLPSEHFEPPYTVGWIELPEGLRVFSQIRGFQERPLRIGLEMEMQVETLWQDEDTETVGYIFRPAGDRP